MGGPLEPHDKRLRQLRGLTELSRALTSAVSLEEVLRLTTERAAALLETDRAVLMLTNADGLLSVRASFGLEPESTDRFREPLGDSLMQRLQGLLRVDPERFIGVPLVVGGEVTGILAVALLESVGPSDEHEWLLSALADQAAVALEKTRLDETSQFRERVIGIVSHDLRNPMSAILMGANLLLGGDAVDPRARKILLRMQSAAERVSRMIGDLLDYIQGQLGGGIPIARSPGDLHAVARQVVDEIAGNHPARTIELSNEGDAHGMWDADRVAQALGNLVSNAVSYSPKEAPVMVKVLGDEATVALMVHNRGAVIPADRLRRIFEPMQRLTVDPSSPSRSVGLGLYIVDKIVAAHQGTVTVASSEATGTIFTITLPRAATEG
jgi:sigma-B regulation protein RsbU (phosphoserine phosphatase)